jgi:hypothetical protein
MGNKMNLTIKGGHGNARRVRLTWVRRQAVIRKRFKGILSQRDVILTFDSKEEAKRAFHFIWNKVLGEPLSALNSIADTMKKK